MKQTTKRLKPGEDLREEIEKIVKENDIQAGCILSVVGSLSRASLRMADGKKIKSWDKPFEIVAGTGTVSVNGCHIHIAISDNDGNVFGGHLKEGCVVRTTAEIVLLVFSEAKYKRIFDEETGYNELKVE
ncbi:MAG: PPC domain-containing DNA-binding protein [Candidatus Jorgensenbacteria bacterium]